MADTKLYGEGGKITCDKAILASIVSLATKEIKGVARLSKSKTSWFKKLFKDEESEGVVVKFDANGSVKVDVYVDVYIGESAPELAFKIQENVKNNLSSMVEIKTSNINVHIMDVICDRIDSGV